MSETVPLIPVLTGATATGKSALALALARRWPLEIVSADAMMVYREMDIGTAKPSPAERAQVKHHLIDVVRPDEAFSVAHYVELAHAAIAEVLGRGRLPLVVGGTGFYLRALSEGLPTTPAADPEVQGRLWQRLEAEGLAALETELAQRSTDDALRAQRNPRRVVRALEVWARTERSPASFPLTQPRYRYSKRLLELDPQVLAGAIAARTAAMFEAGLEAEVQRLLARYPAPTTALQAIGYKEVSQVLVGTLTVTEAQEAVTQATLRYAKRQRTWFKKEPGIEPLSQRTEDAWLEGVWQTVFG